MAEDNIGKIEQETPTGLETTKVTKTFSGSERYLQWRVNQFAPGQFVEFYYNKKRRKVLLIQPDGYKTNLKNKAITLVDFTDIADNPSQISGLFATGGFPTDVKVTIQDTDGFRFFEIDIDDPKLLYNKIKSNQKVKKYYRTFLKKEIKGGVKLYNPKFPESVINKFNIKG